MPPRIQSVKHEITRLDRLITKWKEGDLSTGDVFLVLKVISRANEQGRTCWCEEEGVCCTAHDKHADPHEGCKS